jgi:hypothetical protein
MEGLIPFSEISQQSFPSAPLRERWLSGVGVSLYGALENDCLGADAQSKQH